MARLSDASQGVTKTIDPRSAGKAGFVQAYAGATAPSGWKVCDGSAVSRTDYAQLFANIGTKYGIGDGSTTFNLPDGPLRSKQFDLSLSSTPAGWSTTHAYGYLEKIEGKWYLDFSIHGTYTTSTADQTAVIDGVTSTLNTAIAIMPSATARANAYYAGSSDRLAWYVNGANTGGIQLQGYIEIDAPTDAILAASPYSTLSEVWESTPIIKLYDDSTTAVSVSVAEATADTAGVVMKNRWQKKTLAADVNVATSDMSTTSGNSDFKFTGLTIGQHYELKLNFRQFINAGDAFLAVDVFNLVSPSASDARLFLIGNGNEGSSLSSPTTFGSVVFKATSSDIRIGLSSKDPGSYIVGGVDANGSESTSMTLIERNDLDDEVAIW